MGFKLFNCLLCGYNVSKCQYVCDVCYELLPWNNNACAMCALDLPSVEHFKQNLCLDCRVSPPKFKIITPFYYDKIIAHLIKSIKYYRMVEVHALLAESLVNYMLVNAYLVKADIIVPVPLFAKRQRRRGFNQAIELAKAINKVIGMPVDCDSCMRVKNTPSQTMHNVAARRSNLDDAFATKFDFSGKKVVILDDVVTTGATVSSLAKMLYASGAMVVEVWAIARVNKIL